MRATTSIRVLELHAREVLVEVAPVDAEGALPRLQDHASDRALALAGGAVASVGGQVERRVGDRLGLAGGLLGALLGGLVLDEVGVRVLAELALLALALLLEHEIRLEVHARDDLLLGLVLRALLLRPALARSGLLALGSGLFAFSGRSGLFAFGSRLVAFSGRSGLLGSGLFAFGSGLLSRSGLFALGSGLLRLALGRRRQRLRALDLGTRSAGVLLGRRGFARLAGDALLLGGVGLAFLGEHQASTSRGSGFCAACGWSGPA
jgi:hypothetical protein